MGPPHVLAVVDDDAVAAAPDGGDVPEGVAHRAPGHDEPAARLIADDDVLDDGADDAGIARADVRRIEADAVRVGVVAARRPARAADHREVDERALLSHEAHRVPGVRHHAQDRAPEDGRARIGGVCGAVAPHDDAVAVDDDAVVGVEPDAEAEHTAAHRLEKVADGMNRDGVTGREGLIVAASCPAPFREGFAVPLRLPPLPGGILDLQRVRRLGVRAHHVHHAVEDVDAGPRDGGCGHIGHRGEDFRR